MHLRILATVSIVLAIAAIDVASAERGTPAEAQAMLAKAIAHYKEVGRANALADFNKKTPPFGDRDLYVVCLASDHTEVANGGFPRYVGVSADQVKTADGKPLGTAFWDAAAKGEPSVTYAWTNPVTHGIEKKIGYVQKAGDDVCIVGAYQPS